MMDSCRHRLNARIPPEGLMDWQYKGIVLQALSPDYESIQRACLERRNFGLANIRRMMAILYTREPLSLGHHLSNRDYAAWRGYEDYGSRP